MKIEAHTPDQYVEQLPPERRGVIEQLRETISAALPEGYQECISYGMIGYVVPHSLYPAGYHCDASLPLPFINIASQKSFVALYHMGIYANPELLEWFRSEYPKHCRRKIDMGKSCIRFKKLDEMPFTLIGELAGKMSVQQWISLYESQIKK